VQLKAADDKQPDIAALEALIERPDIEARTKRSIEDEIWSIREGAKAEGDAAYEIEFHLGDNPHFVTIHDLRLDIDGHVAQIDHLVISPVLEVFVCESKRFGAGVKINELLEWTTFRNRRPVGVASPLEQNKRHIAVLERAVKLGYIQPPKRMGLLTMKPTFVSRVLIGTSASITRPRRKAAELDAVVKVDQFRTRLLERDVSNAAMLKLVWGDTLERFGRQFVALHTPHRVDWAARFGLDRGSPARSVSAQPSAGPLVEAASSARPPWRVKYDGPCSQCGRILPKGTPAIWDQSIRKMRCIDCTAALP
jgi:hypothetical protein